VTLSISGNYSNVLDFVSGLQSGPRLYLVSSLSTDTTNGDVSASVGGLVYVLLDAGATGSGTGAGVAAAPAG
jgi:hypothetical protein